MSQELVVPDYLKAMMADGKVEDTTASMKVDAGGVARLTTKGKTFRFKEGEDEEKAGQSVDLVIVGMHPIIGLAHTFYKDGYSPDASSPPDCSSMNGQNPDSWISKPVHSNCASCPNQAWGSAKSMSGGKSKACRDSKQLYVAKAEDFSNDPDNATLYLLQVTVNTLKAFTRFGKEIAIAGLPGPQFIITRVTFDDEASVPKLEFEILGVLNEKLGMASHVRSEAKEWDAGTALPPPSGNDKRSLPKPEDVGRAEASQDSINDQLDQASVSDMLDEW